jgi:hypothetical protein
MNWKRLVTDIAVFVIGGLIYCGIEMLYRGRTHFAMFILAGCCSLVMAWVNDNLSYDMPFWKQVVIASAACIGGEYLTGIIANRQFNIWDYRGLWGTFAGGQLNIVFCLAWVFLSIIGIPLMDYIEWKFLGDETKPYYIICGKKIELKENIEI